MIRIPAVMPTAKQRRISYAGEAHPFVDQPLGWILHVVVGYNSPFGTFQSARAGQRRFSHLWVSQTGAIEQYQDLRYTSWAQAGGNSTYWSVETEGFPDEPLTTLQIDSLARIHRFLGIPDLITNTPGLPGIGTHSMGGTFWGGHACPGSIREAQRDTIIQIARREPAAYIGQESAMYFVQTPVNGAFLLTSLGHFPVPPGAEAWAKRSFPNLTAGAAELTPIGEGLRANAVSVVSAALIDAATPGSSADAIVDALASRLVR